MSVPTSHDQNFKNLILDYPRQALEFFAAQEGEASVLIRLLTRRFGPLDAASLQRLQKANSSELERWTDTILDAQTLDEVFAGQ